MARDSGRYDAFTDTWISDNVQIDFVWGNAPTQPNDDRGQNVLDPILDSHEIVYNTWNGFPAFVPNTVDGISSGSGSGSGAGASVEIPGSAGMTFSQYASLLAGLGLTAVEGSPLENTLSSAWNGSVMEATPTFGTVVQVGTSVTVRAYGEYLAPPVLGPTTDWAFNGMGGSWRFPELTLPTELTSAAAASFKLVVTGGNLAGEYIVSSAGYNMGWGYDLVQTYTRPLNAWSNYRGVGLADNSNFSTDFEDAGTVAIYPYTAPAVLGTNRTNWYFQSGTLYLKDFFYTPTELNETNKNSHLLIITGGQLDGVYPLSNASVDYYSMTQAVRVFNNNTLTSSGNNWQMTMSQFKGSTYIDSMNMMLADAGVVKLVLLEEVQVPQLIGMTGAQATAALAALGLNAVESQTIVGTNGGNVNTVASQTQLGGATVYKGSAVQYAVYSNSMTVDLAPGNVYLNDMGNGIYLTLSQISSSSPAYLVAGNNSLAGKTITFSNIVGQNNMLQNVDASAIMGQAWPITSSTTSTMMGPEASIYLGGGITNPATPYSLMIFSGTATISN